MRQSRFTEAQIIGMIKEQDPESILSLMGVLFGVCKSCR